MVCWADLDQSLTKLWSLLCRVKIYFYFRFIKLFFNDLIWSIFIHCLTLNILVIIITTLATSNSGCCNTSLPHFTVQTVCLYGILHVCIFSMHLIDTEHSIDKYLYIYIYCVLICFFCKNPILHRLIKNVNAQTRLVHVTYTLL